MFDNTFVNHFCCPSINPEVKWGYLYSEFSLRLVSVNYVILFTCFSNSSLFMLNAGLSKNPWGTPIWDCKFPRPTWSVSSFIRTPSFLSGLASGFSVNRSGYRCYWWLPNLNDKLQVHLQELTSTNVTMKINGRSKTRWNKYISQNSDYYKYILH